MERVPIIAVEPDGHNVRFESLRACCDFYGIPHRDVITEREMWGDSWHGIHFDFPVDVDDAVIERLRSQLRRRRRGGNDEKAFEDV